jgi:hypothetical protein
MSCTWRWTESGYEWTVRLHSGTAQPISCTAPAGKVEGFVLRRGTPRITQLHFPTRVAGQFHGDSGIDQTSRTRPFAMCGSLMPVASTLVVGVMGNAVLSWA